MKFVLHATALAALLAAPAFAQSGEGATNTVDLGTFVYSDAANTMMLSDEDIRFKWERLTTEERAQARADCEEHEAAKTATTMTPTATDLEAARMVSMDEACARIATYPAEG